MISGKLQLRLTFDVLDNNWDAMPPDKIKEICQKVADLIEKENHRTVYFSASICPVFHTDDEQKAMLVKYNRQHRPCCKEMSDDNEVAHINGGVITSGYSSVYEGKLMADVAHAVRHAARQ